MAKARNACSPSDENGFEPASFLRHLGRVENVRLVDRQDSKRADDAEKKGADDHRLGAEAVIEHAADERAEHAGQRQYDAEDAELERAPAEDVGAVDAAEGEDGGEAVGVDHARQQEQQHVGVRRQRLDGVPQLGRGGAAGRRGGAGLPGIGDEQEKRNREDREPDGGEGADEAIASRVLASSANKGSSPSDGLAAHGIGDDEPGHDDEAHEPAGIADRPARCPTGGRAARPARDRA